MEIGWIHLAVLVAALALMACSEEQEPEEPPCIPLEGTVGDPCEGEASAALAPVCQHLLRYPCLSVLGR